MPWFGRETQEEEHIRKIRNPNTSKTLFEAYAELYQNDLKMIEEIANGPACPASILTQLATHSDYVVRRRVSGHANTPPELLSAISKKEKNPYVHCAVLDNPNTPQEDIVRLYSYVEDSFKYETIHAMAPLCVTNTYFNPNTPKWLKARIKTKFPWCAKKETDQG
jgi:hypothetical protein